MRRYLLIVMIFMGLLSRAENAVNTDSLKYQFETARQDTVRIDILVKLSQAYLRVDLIRSMDYANQAYEQARKSNNQKFIASTLFNRANNYSSIGLNELAVKDISEFLKIQRKAGNKRMMAFALSNLGAIRLQIKEYDKAQANFNEALGVFNELVSDELPETGIKYLPSLYNNMGIVSQHLKKFAEAITYYEKGILLTRQMPRERVTLGMLLNNLGSVYLEQKDYEKAYQYMQEALSVRLSNKDLIGEAQSYRMLANYYVEVLRTDLALEYLYKSFNIANAAGDKLMISTLVNNIYEVYKEKGQSDSALKYHILLKEILDTLNLQATQKELTKLELTEQFEEKELLLTMEQKRRELWFLFSGLSLLLVLAIFILLYFLSQSRLKRIRAEKINADLASKNLELEKINLEQQLEIRNKELATQVMFQIQKNELINEILQKLMKHSHSLRKDDQDILFGIIRDLEKAHDVNVWNDFEIRFNQVHSDFYRKLQETFPDLSLNERRLCAFLRLNMTTKEIASITGQSVRSLEVARTRLRKKLNLTNSESGLTEYLAAF